MGGASGKEENHTCNEFGFWVFFEVLRTTRGERRRGAKRVRFSNTLGRKADV